VAIRIKSKNSVIKDKAPLPADLEIGELALNAHQDSPAIYLKDAAGVVRKIAGTGAVGATDATTTAKGVVQLADAAAVTAGTAGRVVDAAQLKAAVAAEDLWDRSGTEISPKTAGDSVFTAGAVKVGGTTASPNITLKADGKIGVGTAAPANSFHAVGTSAELVAGFQNWGGFAKFGVSAAGNAVAGASTPSQAFELWAGNAEKARITTTGDFLLGGTLPSAPNITLKADGNIDAVCAADARIHISKAGGDTAAIGVDGTGINTHCYVGGGNYLDFRAGGLTADKAWGVLTPAGNFHFGGGTNIVMAPNLQFTQAGNINSKGALARVYADNGSAKAGGLVAGDIYRTSTGQLMITF
jgi:hypothetical protein